MATARTRAKHIGDGSVAGGRKRRRRDQEVVRAATAVFYRSGYANATVQDVADALGMLKGSLYYYINSKEELLYRLATEVHDAVDALMADVIALRHLTALERLHEFVRRQAEYNIDHLEAIAVYHHDVHHLGRALRNEIIERRRKHEQVLVSLLEDAQHSGEMDASLDPYIVSQLIFATVIWIYRWYRRGNGVDAHAVSETCARFVMDGLVGSLPRSDSAQG
jgi:AcrR family transcriptional regulator